MIKFFSLFLAINKNNLMKREREREEKYINQNVHFERVNFII